MSYFRYFIVAVICLGVTNPAYGDLFRSVELEERPRKSEFERWLVVYQNRTNLEYLVHLQVDNPDCSVGGKGVLVKVQDSANNTVRAESVPGFGARAMSLIVPANGRIRVKFLGDTQDGTNFADCTSSFPRAYYHLSEPIPTGLLPP